jgi:hypothetical protein
MLHYPSHVKSLSSSHPQESLLHWAIENSDPAVLADRAGRKDKGQEEVVKDFLERKQRVKVVGAVLADGTDTG